MPSLDLTGLCEPQHQYDTRMGKSYRIEGLGTYYYEGVNYQQMKQDIARDLREAQQNRIRREKKTRKIKPLNKSRFYKQACAHLRKMKKDGIILSMPKHPIQYFKSIPNGDVPELFIKYWKQDRVFRAVARERATYGFVSWEIFTANVLDRQVEIVKNLLKPFKRMLAQGKISWPVAKYIADYPLSAQEKFLHDPKWTLKSRNKFHLHKLALSLAATIKRNNRKPSRCITNITEKNAVILKYEMAIALDTFCRAGGISPTSLKSIIKLHKDIHDPNSAAYKLINQKTAIPTYKLDGDLPELPELGGATIELFHSVEDFAKERDEMKHCIYSYTGRKGIFARVKRGELRATLYVDPEKRLTQCQGRFNSKNELTQDVYSTWIPILQPFAEQANYTLINPVAHDLIPHYD